MRRPTPAVGRRAIPSAHRREASAAYATRPTEPTAAPYAASLGPPSDDLRLADCRSSRPEGVHLEDFTSRFVIFDLKPLDETQQRGFNALRLDPCPHLVATPENGIHLDRCELMPPGGRQVEVKIRNALQHR